MKKSNLALVGGLALLIGGVGLIKYRQSLKKIERAEEERQKLLSRLGIDRSSNIVEGLFKSFEKTDAGNVDEAFDADRGKVIHVSLQNSENLEYLFEVPESIFTKGYKPFVVSDFIRTLRNEGTNIANELGVRPSFGGLKIVVFVEYEYEDEQDNYYYACGEIPDALMEDYKTERDPRGVTTFYEKIINNSEFLNKMLPTIFNSSRVIKNIKAVDYMLVYKISFNVLGEKSPSGITLEGAHTALEKFLNVSVCNKQNTHTWSNIMFHGQEPGTDRFNLLWYYQRDRDGNISVDNYVYD